MYWYFICFYHRLLFHCMFILYFDSQWPSGIPFIVKCCEFPFTFVFRLVWLLVMINKFLIYSCILSVWHLFVVYIVSMACPFRVLNLYFDEDDFLILMFGLSIVSVLVSAFCILFNKSLPTLRSWRYSAYLLEALLFCLCHWNICSAWNLFLGVVWVFP